MFGGFCRAGGGAELSAFLMIGDVVVCAFVYYYNYIIGV